MGILARDGALIEQLIADGMLPQGFSVCELGNQIYRGHGGESASTYWYGRIGAGPYASIDANGEATHFADLNLPLGRLINARFDLVTDFGTGEHIFNQAQVWQTLHDLAKPGGFIALHRPCQGWRDHCFYNIHPTLIADIAVANGYKIYVMEEREERHGTLLSAILQKTSDAPFRYPNQGKYKAMLAAAEQRATTWIDTNYDESLETVTRAEPKRRKRGDVLIELVREHGWTVGAEIGVYNGEAVFFRLLDAFPELRMVAIDRWSKTDGDYGDLTEIGKTFCARSATYGWRTSVMQGDSVAVAEDTKEAFFDFIFIDASHDYESVKADIAAWTPKVKPGGMVLGHDWNPRFPGVIQAVTEAFGTPHLFDDHVWGVSV